VRQAAQARHHSLADVWLASLLAVGLAAAEIARVAAAAAVEKGLTAHTSRLVVGYTLNLRVAAVLAGFELEVMKTKDGDDGNWAEGSKKLALMTTNILDNQPRFGGRQTARQEEGE